MKKKLLFLVAIILSIAVFTFVLAGCEDEVDLPENVVFRGSVGQVADDPLTFTGKIALRGIVSVIDAGNQTLFSIRERTTAACCPDIFLRVQYLGDEFIPTVDSDIYVIGSWGTVLNPRGVGYISHIFNATSVQRRG